MPSPEGGSDQLCPPQQWWLCEKLQPWSSRCQQALWWRGWSEGLVVGKDHKFCSAFGQAACNTCISLSNSHIRFSNGGSLNFFFFFNSSFSLSFLWLSQTCADHPITGPLLQWKLSSSVWDRSSSGLSCTIQMIRQLHLHQGWMQL